MSDCNHSHKFQLQSLVCVRHLLSCSVWMKGYVNSALLYIYKVPEL